MRPNRLRQLWRDGGAAVNGWLQLPHGFAAEVMAAQGWDSLTVDMQHGPIGYDVALTLLQALSSSDGHAARPGALERARHHHEDARCRLLRHHLPDGQLGRGGAALRRRLPLPAQGLPQLRPDPGQLLRRRDYGQHANDTVIALAMIETAQAIENLDAILDTPGLDGVYVGPADLSQSLGYQERVDLKHPDLVAILEKIQAGCERRGLIAGIHVGSTDYARHIIGKGYRFVTILSDARLLANAAKQAVDAVKGAGGEREAGRPVLRRRARDRSDDGLPRRQGSTRGASSEPARRRAASLRSLCAPPGRPG